MRNKLQNIIDMLEDIIEDHDELDCEISDIIDYIKDVKKSIIDKYSKRSEIHSMFNQGARAEQNAIIHMLKGKIGGKEVIKAVEKVVVRM